MSDSFLPSIQSSARILAVGPVGAQARLRLLLAAAADAPAILALHGFTGCGMDFLPLVEYLHEQLGHGCHWALFDFPGHGLSDRPTDATAYQLSHVLHLIELARHQLPASARVTLLLGYSMGARLALHYLRRAAALPAFLIGGSPGIASTSERAARRAADEHWLRYLREQSIADFADAWEAQTIIAPQTQLPEPLRSQLAMRRRQACPRGLALAMENLGTGALPSLWDELAALPPLCLASGREDTKFAAIHARMAMLNPAFRCLTIPASGHAPHLENPCGTARALVQAFPQLA